ncbi:GTPase Era [Candidatus Calescamantes bacterium]|nr:GTPase Era [Candidatus Calescamantes bacterium]
MKEFPSDYRSGYVALVGPPNVGKSTLLNYLIGEKISIISPRPQTTRFLVRAIVTFPEAQLVFVDTPGLLEASRLKTPVERAFVIQALKYLEEVDIVVMMVEPHPPREEEIYLVERIEEIKKKTILAINKMDKVKSDYVEWLMEEYKKIGDFHRIIPISAKKGTNVTILVGEIILALPFQPPIYPEDIKTDLPRELWIAEIIREKIFHLTYYEVPYATLVKVEEMKDKGKVFYIKATIFVEEPSQKGILVGKGGKMIKEIGRRAREELEVSLGKKVYLELEVRVEKGWRRRESSLKELGLT